jgi:hypothetical protein
MLLLVLLIMQRTINAGEDVGKKKQFYTVGGKAN